MHDRTNFATMLKLMWDMQNPLITIEFLDEKLCGDKWYVTHHIVVPNGKDKVLDFCFVDGRSTNNNYLYCIDQLDMDLLSAVTHFSKRVLASQGAKLTFYGN